MSDLDLVQLAENPDPRAPCVLLLDTSASMSGAPIRALNEGLKVFHQDITQDALAQRRVELAILTFGSRVTLIQDFVTADAWEPQTLTSGGSTPLGGALAQGVELLRARKSRYKEVGLPYYRPWLFLVTDGEPTDAWEEAAVQAQREEQDKGMLFFTVGVEGANMAKLAQIAPAHRPPLKLKGLRFNELFLWLSQSQRRVSHSQVGDMLALPPIGWGEASS